MNDIRKLQDIQINDIDLVETYRDTFNNESIETAQNLINTNTLKSYVLQAEWMNNVKTKIEELEEYKQSNCDDIFNDKTREFQSNVDKLIYINQYKNKALYRKNNFVLYDNDIYFCIKDAYNIVPTNTEYWVKIGLLGEKGQYSLGIFYRGFWNYNAEYRKYDLVVYDKNLYVARNNNVHSCPIPKKTYYLKNNLRLNDDIYLEKKSPHSEGKMNFLNNSLFLGNKYLANSWSNNDWFKISDSEDLLQIYDSPENYTTLPIHSVFFQKL